MNQTKEPRPQKLGFFTVRGRPGDVGPNPDPKNATETFSSVGEAVMHAESRSEPVSVCEHSVNHDGDPFTRVLCYS
jgi:hypothetical protein